ncbi:SRPBCC family protein [Actinomadura rupiterrae]|uniref:SRPBCC family protein n=1 Tax=Actinomadura rupiterrae TaxID=559627 RepID=UPI0020A47975|nr:SRPBCC family protein [Actinomadura rupiterrae]MCP2340686.1 putative membrane protein [Actinomadura rupiterrae]
MITVAAAGVLASAADGAQAAERHHAGAPQCRGAGVDPAARVRYETDIFIKAPLSTVFKVQTDVRRWPSWQKPVLSMKLLDPGRLRPGSRFRWTTPGPATPTTPATTMTITSTIQRIKQNDCILWSGPAIGDGVRIDQGVHLWKFTKVKGGVHVHTEETWTGKQVDADVPTATRLLGDGLKQWLLDLKATSEARAHDHHLHKPAQSRP